MSALALPDVVRSHFDAFARSVGASDPPFLRRLRDAAMVRFAERGFPTTRDEAWRSTSVAPIAKTAFRRPDPEASVDEDLLPGGLRAVFVNGRFSPVLSSGEFPQGLRVRSLRQALVTEPDRVEAHLGELACDPADAFAALNTAFLEDGVLVEVEPGAIVEEPLSLVFVSSNHTGEPSQSHARTLVLAGRGSQATLIQAYVGREGESYLTTAVTELLLEDGAILDHHHLQRESTAAYHVARLAVRQGRDSRFSDHAFALGAALSRRDIELTLDGEGAEGTLNGLFMVGGSQHADTHSRIDHRKPHGTSRQLYKGVLDGRARGVFHGEVVVQKGAQKTDALQNNKNLLLSREALVNSTPSLRIFADDVKCKHGSTTGQLDPVALFYLRSRGIAEDQARSLLTYAFASDVVGRVQVERLRVALERWLTSHLPGSGEEWA
jgi:Fe-S cluster assembly protein SufD